MPSNDNFLQLDLPVEIYTTMIMLYKRPAKLYKDPHKSVQGWWLKRGRRGRAQRAAWAVYIACPGPFDKKFFEAMLEVLGKADHYELAWKARDADEWGTGSKIRRVLRDAKKAGVVLHKRFDVQGDLNVHTARGSRSIHNI